jgi:hypothetical protein
VPHFPVQKSRRDMSLAVLTRRFQLPLYCHLL